MHAKACISTSFANVAGYLIAQRPTANYRICEEVKRHNNLHAAIVKTKTT
jgi:hypothetical protein